MGRLPIHPTLLTMTRYHLLGFALAAATTAYVLAPVHTANRSVAHHGASDGLSAVSGGHTPAQGLQAPSGGSQASLTSSPHANGLDTAP